MRLPFAIEATDGEARAARMTTLHGAVQTPVFMPVGTRATVRGQTVDTLRGAGAQVLLANTWHLMLRPGADVFEQIGGIHRFMAWDLPVLTDSGGYQVFSLSARAELSEQGVVFHDPASGRRVPLSPEQSVGMQRAIGSDLWMVLDHCVPGTADRAVAEDAMHRTHRWARRSLAARGDAPQALFGIVQGACHADLRAQSADTLTQEPFDGFAIGGLAVGESAAEREAMTEVATSRLPSDRPRYLMGVGTPLDLLEAVRRGVDLFDCILPTAHGQRGLAYTSRGRLELRRGVYRVADEPLDPACRCPVCARHSRAYLHHLVKTEEVLAWQLLGQHNLHFYADLMADLRAAIRAGTFTRRYQALRPVLDASDLDHPISPPQPKRRRAPPPEQLGDYEVFTPPGATTGRIRQRSSGETMHSVNDPAEEAERLYIAQSRLRERLASGSEALVVWDVGLGAATNAMAALGCAEATGGRLDLWSFERDLDPLRLAAQHPERFPHLRHRAPHAILRGEPWSSPDGRVHWQLLAGDFAETQAAAPSPDLVFYDPFSSKVDADLWSLAAFQALRSRQGSRDLRLYTYTNATPIRAALLVAGFFVSRGAGSGPKTETTAASTCPPGVADPPALDAAWLARWERSGRRHPEAIARAGSAAVAAFEDAVRKHPQFLPPPEPDGEPAATGPRVV